ncbi:hypothetical protein [Haloferax volcanii]|uniref:Uncharacterized protein n=1 Tax=Haloferax volcanii TaxID=2246 RepID=A0A847TUG2_HALVO|nr:hypothetical protein [Haloferax alexandrinus]NLV02301.1 hypothetical protein [Haloferax alexandrinus]
MSRQRSRDSRTGSDYHPSHHRPAPSLATQAALLTSMAAVVAVVTYPVASLAVAVTVAVARVVVTRVDRSMLTVDVPGVPVEVTVARTARD